MKSFTVEEVAKHSSANDCWIIVEGKVFDVTKFLSDHPGGKKVLLKVAGKDASKQFKSFHNDAIMQRVGLPLQIGVIGTAGPVEQAPVKKEEKKVADTQPTETYSISGLISGAESKFGEGIPYGDPTWYQDWNR